MYLTLKMRILYTIILCLILEITEIHSNCVLFRNTVFQSLGTDCGHKCTEKSARTYQYCDGIRKPGCYCKPGYYRDWSYNCIRGSQCDKSGPSRTRSLAPPPKQKKCYPNELFTDCGNYCIENCKNSGKDVCPLNKCDIGCTCTDGYNRDDEGVCVPQKKCGVQLPTTKSKSPKVCPFGEQYNDCGKRCSESCGQSKCKGKEKCEKGCFCKHGYSRNTQGNCVPAKDCIGKGSQCKKPNEVFEMCGNACADLCNPPIECPAKCKPGCYCKKPDYFRDGDRNCVKEGKNKAGPKSCLPIPKTATPKPKIAKDCKKNEVYKLCGTLCGQSCSSLNKEYVCPRRKICVKGCFCKEGHYRNKAGNCMPEDKCDSGPTDGKKKPKCKKTEVYKECGNPCVELCNPPAICSYECQSGCYCKENFYRNRAGVCVPLNKCPPLVDHDNGDPDKCSPPMKRNKCRKNCIQSCAEVAAKMVCPRRKACIAGCFCKEGELKDYNSGCVAANQCPAGPSKEPKTEPKEENEVPDCDDNEEYYPCGDYCVELCKPPPSCKRKCKSGCFCKRYFYRNEKGVCVPNEKCGNRMPAIPPKKKIGPNDCKKKNEEYSTCGRPKCHSCLELSKGLMCPNRQGCETGCFCRGGFYRTHPKGDCVPLSKCIPKVPDFKEMATTTPRPKDDDCKDNEHYEECGDHCIELCTPPDSCDAQCDKGCFCDKGHYRASPKGPCVPEKKCPGYNGGEVSESVKVIIRIKLKCEDGEMYSECGTRCGQMCSDLFKSVICPKKGLCVTGCYCQEGSYRNNKGKCVPAAQCTDERPPPQKEFKCGDNEAYNKCGDRCSMTCEARMMNMTCPKAKCSAGCFCTEGYFKDAFGNCVLLKDCPETSVLDKPKPMQCEKNEDLKECGNRCGQTCQDVLDNTQCSRQRACVMGCFCKKGLLRNYEGKCVPQEECPKEKPKDKMDVKCEENEEYSKCNARCAQGCDDLGGKVVCPKELQCASGCFCKEGFYRNEMGDCIPESECPDVGPPTSVAKPKLDCGENEEYNECGTRCGSTCDDLGRRVVCSRRRICISGCFCVSGYFRDDAGVCVQMLECPNISPPKRAPPSCDANEEYNECGHRCGQSCEDHHSKKTCPAKQSCVSGCFCTPDNKRDHNGECLPEDKCPPPQIDTKADVKCGNNEMYSDCGSRCGQGCEDLVHPTACPKNRMCVSGCFCNEGFYRNEMGDCVPESKCPAIPSETSKPKECGANEIHTDCGTHCGQKCEEIGQGVKCPRKRLCIKGCFCKKGFFRDVNDDCVPQKQCSEKKEKRAKKEEKEEKDEKDGKEDDKEDDKEEEGGTEGTDSTGGTDATTEANSDGTSESSESPTTAGADEASTSSGEASETTEAVSGTTDGATDASEATIGSTDASEATIGSTDASEATIGSTDASEATIGSTDASEGTIGSSSDESTTSSSSE